MGILAGHARGPFERSAMTAPAATDLDSIRERATAASSKHGVVRAGVFGSFVRGVQKPDSDVDLLVEFEPGAPCSTCRGCDWISSRCLADTSMW